MKNKYLLALILGFVTSITFTSDDIELEEVEIRIENGTTTYISRSSDGSTSTALHYSKPIEVYENGKTTYCDHIKQLNLQEMNNICHPSNPNSKTLISKARKQTTLSHDFCIVEQILSTRPIKEDQEFDNILHKSKNAHRRAEMARRKKEK